MGLICVFSYPFVFGRAFWGNSLTALARPGGDPGGGGGHLGFMVKTLAR